MGSSDYLDLGNWNATCSMCGRKRKASDLVRNWMGQYRCPEHNEPRHPQDFVRATPDVQTPPWTQPPSDLLLVQCTYNGQSSRVDIGTVDCLLVDNDPPINDPSAP